MRHAIVGFLICLLWGWQPLRIAAQVKVQATLEATDMLIGEQVRLKARVEAPKGAKVVFPQFSNGYITEGVEVLEQSIVDTLQQIGEQQIVLERTYTITAFDSALYNLPTLEVLVNGKKYYSAGNIGLKVSTVPVDTLHPEKMAGPHAAVEGVYRWHSQLWVTTLIPLFLLCVVLSLAIRLSTGRPITRRVVIKPPKPAHVQALEELSHINLPKNHDMNFVRDCFVQLTDTLRTYVGSRYGFGATQLTTSEIVRYLQQHTKAEVQMALRHIFETADLVKFAKHPPTVFETEHCLKEAVGIVEKTQQAPHELPQPEVREVSLSERKQQVIRIGMKVGLGILLIGEMLLISYLCVEIYNNFF